MEPNLRDNAFPSSAGPSTVAEAAPRRLSEPDLSDELPRRPVLHIRAMSGWQVLEFRELWHYRELLTLLVWKDLRVRYKQAVLGVAWVVLQPLFTVLIFTLIFGVLVKVPSDGTPFLLFAFAALLPWNYFSAALLASTTSVVGNSHLVTKVYFPRVFIPAVPVFSGLVGYGITLLVMVLVMVANPMMPAVVPPMSALLTIPMLTVLTAALSLGCGLWLSALNVRYRDTTHAVPFLMQGWMYASPVVYPLSIVPERWRWVALVNPMTGIIESYRAALLSTPWHWPALGISVVVTLVLLVTGALYFRYTEDVVADIV